MSFPFAEIRVGLLAASLGVTACSSFQPQVVDSHTFLIKAAQDDQAEVLLGQLALEKATSNEVKVFAQRIVEDHEQSSKDIAQLAARKNLSLQQDLSEQQKGDYATLSALSGAQFDKTYMEHNVTDHAATVKEFRTQAKHGTDPEIQAFANRTLPTLQSHLEMARQVDRHLGR